MFRLGLIINPLAGLGGSVALKGSDGVAEQALALGAIPKAGMRTAQALDVLLPFKDQLHIVTCAADMGENLCREMGFQFSVLDLPLHSPSSAADTRAAAAAMRESRVDLLLFAGGDGTARDICAVVQDSFPVLGIPAGVKIHSAVYGVNPRSSGEVVAMLLRGELVDIKTQDVRDIDEEAFRNNQVRARLFGEMLVPQAGEFVQGVKMGGIEHEDLVLDDIAADLHNRMLDDVLYLVGSGKTTEHVMHHLGLENTLLGVDAVYAGDVIAADVSEQHILALLQQYPKAVIIISIIGGQGHIFGRGNQQFSPAVIEKIGRSNIWVLASKAKLKSLEGRALRLDTGDSALDKKLEGLMELTTGYHDRVLYPVKA